MYLHMYARQKIDTFTKSSSSLGQPLITEMWLSICQSEQQIIGVCMYYGILTLARGSALTMQVKTSRSPGPENTARWELETSGGSVKRKTITNEVIATIEPH